MLILICTDRADIEHHILGSESAVDQSVDFAPKIDFSKEALLGPKISLRNPSLKVHLQSCDEDGTRKIQGGGQVGCPRDLTRG